MSIRIDKAGKVRLDGDDMTLLRTRRFTMDKFRCRRCNRPVSPFAPEWAPNRAHLAHLIGRGAGGSDTLGNTETACGGCHSEEEHWGGKKVRSKA